MAQKRSTTKPKMTNLTRPVFPRTGVVAFLAAFAGVLIAVPVALAALMPMVRQQIASATAGLKPTTLQVAPASSTLSSDVCAQPAGVQTAASSGHVLGASTTQQPSGNNNSGGSGGSTGGTTFVKKLVNGVFTANGTIADTGPGSTNAITTTQTANMTVTNTNDVSVSNTNSQTSSSGSAETEHNTSGGAAVSGDATNTNSAKFDFSITN